MSGVVANDLPEGWEYVPLKDAVHIILGQSPSSTTYNKEGNGLPFFQGKTEFGEIYPTVRQWCTEPKKIAEKEDVLVSVRAPVGPTNLAPSECAIGRGLAALRPLGGSDSKYFLYLIRRYQDKLASLGTGTTFEAISGDTLKSFIVPVAPLEQQKRIVAKIEELFSHIDAGIEALKKAKQLLKQYRQSVLKAAVTGELTKEWREENGVSFNETWQSLELGDVVEIIDPNPSHRYPPYDDGDVPLMATKQMVGEEDWDESTAKLTTTEFYEQRKASHGFKSDDIIFARKGRLGLARRPPKLSRYAFSHTIFIIRGNEDIHSEYLLWFLRREEAISWMLREMNVAAGVPTLGKAILGKLPLLLPSKKEQKIIAERIEEKFTAIRRMTENIGHQLMKAEKNKQSVLVSAFQGKV